MLKHIFSKLTGRSEQNKLPTYLDSLLVVPDLTEKQKLELQNAFKNADNTNAHILPDTKIEIKDAESLTLKVGNLKIEGAGIRSQVWVDDVEQTKIKSLTLTLIVGELPRVVIERIVY